MLTRRMYYLLKPWIPRTARMAARRWSALRILKRSKAVWPVNPAAGNAPPGWPGWPDGKRFALVLTHDVEGAIGYKKVRQLMDLEVESGCRSSFNFVPEGEYQAEKGLREQLYGENFEVGIHDLHHDGKLYDSRKGFRANARRINQYLKEWNAVGFRSAFMLHNLEWLGDLEVLYDASTFDTDPFEPQPDGVNTIFPFWVPKSDQKQTESTRKGYVELPYTLVQDSTLFLLLRETSIRIWSQKLDWIANRGGVALLNTHPDYMDFSSSTNGGYRTYPASLYQQFLSYVKDKYEGQYWAALPREVATYVAERCATPALID
jgi:hypothetical protein